MKTPKNTLVILLIAFIFINVNAQKIVKKYYKNGNLEMVGTTINGKLSGEFKYYYENGNIKIIDHYRKGKSHGKTITYYKNGNIEGIINYVDGIKYGEYKYYYENGNLNSEGTYKNNKEIGRWKYFSKNGVLDSSVDFIGSNDYQKFIKYYETGEIKFRVKIDDDLKFQGEKIAYYKNGNIMYKGMIVNGKANGIFKVYDKKGKFLKNLNYINGVLKK